MVDGGFGIDILDDLLWQRRIIDVGSITLGGDIGHHPMSGELAASCYAWNKNEFF